jgi:hypothetical protein
MELEPVNLLAPILALLWPAIAVVALVLFRRPLVELVGILGQRLQKISIGTLALELAAISELKLTALDTEVRKLDAAPSMQSGASSLFGLMAQPRQGHKHDYVVIDQGLETAPRWLTSRLYLLAFLITRIDGPKCLVFIETTGNVRGRFVETAAPEQVRWALTRTYSWLETACAAAYAGLGPLQFEPESGALPEWQSSQLIQNFLSNIRATPAPSEFQSTSAPIEAGWIELGDGSLEHAKWLDGGRVERLLGSDLTTSCVVQFPNHAISELTGVVLREPGRYVAVADTDRKFLNFIDRETVLENLAAEFVKNSRLDSK